MNVWRLSWRVSQHEPRSFWLGGALFLIFFTMPAAIGLVLSRAFGALSDGDLDAVVRWAGLLVVLEVLRMVSIHWGAIVWTRAWIHMQTILRANMLAAQVASGGREAGRPVGSAGEAITHFRDDTEDVANFVDGMIDVAGGLSFTIVAGVLLGATDAVAAMVLVVPLLAVGVMTRLLDGRIKEYRAADREATAAVTGMLGDTMSGATTVKVNGADEAVLSRLEQLVDRRQVTATRDRVLEEILQAFSRGAADVGLGLVLVVAASALASGRFDTADLALFVAYLGWLSFLPRMVGRMLARRKQAGVAFERMSALVADENVDHTVLPRELPIGERQERRREPDMRPDRVRLDRIELDGLTATYPTGGGISDVSCVIERGDLVVVTGPVGAGKSTLLRAVLGLAWQAHVSGRVLWNGVAVEDLAAFMVPPNAAFVSQVPRLISDTVADNIALGDADEAAIARALEISELSADIGGFEHGASTLIGPRGLRLSGGQRQRLAGARALVHRPELLVLDDLSSALDVETELRLWDQLKRERVTVLAVSHRDVAFERATRILHVDGGQVVGGIDTAGSTTGTSRG